MTLHPAVCLYCLLALALPAMTQGTSTVAARTTPKPEPATPKAPANGDYTGPCAQGDALRDLELFGDAEKDYKKIAGKERCARSGLLETARLKKKATETNADTLISAARRFQASGLDDQADEKVKKLVEDHPDRAVPGDLRQPDQRIGWWQGTLNATVPFVRLVAELIIAGLLLLVAGALLIRLVTGAAARVQRSMRVAPVEGSGDAALNQSLPSALFEHLRQLKERGSSVNVRVAKATDSEFSKLPDALGSAFPQAGIVAVLAGVANRLIPSRLRLAALTARPADPFRGLGVTVAVQKPSGESVRETTVWERDFGLLDGVPDPADGDDTPGRYQRLMLPAAVWLAYQKDFGFDSRKKPLNTGEWRSYAHFATGAVAHRQGGYPRAESQYLLALDQDKNNEGARLNLGSLLLSPKAAESRKQRDDRLGAAVKLLAPLAPDLGDKDQPGSFWYQARYLTAVAHLYAKNLGESLKVLDAVARALAEKKSGTDLEEIRKLTTGLVVSLRASVQLEKGDARVPEPHPDPIWETGPGYYNLACFYARKHGKTASGSPKGRLQNSALEYLLAALARGDELLRRYAQTDPALQSLQDVEKFKQLVSEPGANKEVGLPLIFYSAAGPALYIQPTSA